MEPHSNSTLSVSSPSEDWLMWEQGKVHFPGHGTFRRTCSVSCSGKCAGSVNKPMCSTKVVLHIVNVFTIFKSCWHMHIYHLKTMTGEVWSKTWTENLSKLLKLRGFILIKTLNFCSNQGDLVLTQHSRGKGETVALSFSKIFCYIVFLLITFRFLHSSSTICSLFH